MLFLQSNFNLTLHPTGGAVWNGNSYLALTVKFGFAAPCYLKLNAMRNQTKTQNTISIEEVEVLNGTVTVDYLFNDNLLVAKLCYDCLKKFALNRGMNEFVYDYCVNGEHDQTETAQAINDYLAENTKEVVLAYLLEYPLDSVTLALDTMMVRLRDSILLTA